MIAANVNLFIAAGATFQQVLQYVTRDADSCGEGTGVDITLWSAKMQLRESISGAVALELTQNNGILIDPYVLGEFSINMTAAQTAALTAAEYVYDLFFTDLSGNVIKLMSGKAEVDPAVTR